MRPPALPLRAAVLAAAALAAVAARGTATAAVAAAEARRPTSWAQAVKEPLVPNLYRVEADLFRSAEPDARGLARLRELGVSTVLSLRAGHDDAAIPAPPGLRLLHVPMRVWFLRDDRLLAALRIMTDRRNRPLLVHCRRGADRTGVVVALYRIVVQGWAKEEAIREMKEGGFHYHAFWTNVARHVEGIDVERFRRELGILPPRSPSE